MHRILYIVFVLAISLSAVNQLTGIVKIKKLEGFVLDDSMGKPALSSATFFDGSWQDSMSVYVSKSINSKPAYIRFRNYFDYKIFNLVHVHNVFKGKNDYLFYGSKHYMEGKSNSPIDVMEENVVRFKYIQDSLREKDVQVLYVIAPEKMFVYPEYLPNQYTLTDGIRFSYDNYVRFLAKNEVEYIDFNQWFVELKGKVPYALFAKGGKHWTHYYATMAVDSIGTYLLEKGCGASNIKNVEVRDNERLWGEDMDTWNAANLPFPYEKEKIVNLSVEFEDEKKDDVIYFADSYFHAIAWSYMFKGVHGENSEFWYYNKERNNVDNESLGATSQKAFDEKKVKAYILLISVGNINSFDFGFIDYF